MSAAARPWTMPADVVARARRRWDSGAVLAIAARPSIVADPAGARDPVLRVPVHGPRAGDRSADIDALRRWLSAWRAAPPVMHVTWRAVSDRVVGRLELPVAVQVDSPDGVAALLREEPALAAIRAAVRAAPEVLGPWIAARPMRVLTIGGDWPAVVAAAGWLADHPDSGVYARQIPVAGVHTKLVERYRREIAELVTLLRSDRVAGAPMGSGGRTWFEARHGLATRPLRVRLRFLDPAVPGALGALPDVEVPVADAAALDLRPGRVLVVENEISFLALPPMPGTMAILGGGNAAPALLAGLPWLPRAGIAYWGDIDTHGLVILDRVRAAIPGLPVISLLMDRATLLAHRDLWTVEDSPATATTTMLTPDEQQVLDDLRADRLGHGVRLEQERIPWSVVQAVLADVAVPAGPAAPGERQEGS